MLVVEQTDVSSTSGGGGLDIIEFRRQEKSRRDVVIEFDNNNCDVVVYLIDVFHTCCVICIDRCTLDRYCAT